MNKKVLVFCVFISLSSLLIGEEVENLKDKVSFGTYALIQSKKSGGGLCFSVPVFQKDSFTIREEINLNSYFSNTPLTQGKCISLGDKIHFGSIKNINGFNFRSYGYAKCEFGVSWNKEYAIFTQAPMILEMGGAGGFEFLYSPKKSFFIEYGGGSAIKSWGNVSIDDFEAGSFKNGYVCITTGAKHYF